MLRTSLNKRTILCIPKVASRCLSGSSKFVLPGLEYDYGELEPFIKAEIMEIHHSKHHATYVNNLNVAAEKLQESIVKNDISSIVSLQQVIKFNGGDTVICLNNFTSHYLYVGTE